MQYHPRQQGQTGLAKPIRRYIMKKLPIIITAAVLLCGLVVACILLFPNTPTDSGNTENTESTVYVENALTLYEEAVRNLPAGDLQLRVKEKRTIINSGVPYEVQRDYTIQYDRSDPQDQRYLLKDTITMGSHSITREEYRVKDHWYMLVSGLAFRDATLKSAALRYYNEGDPAAALDHTLYAEVTATQTENGYHFVFSEATGHVPWLFSHPQSIEYIKATAEVSKEKQLLSYTYATAWQEAFGRAEVSYEVIIEPMDITITLPEPEGGWLPLTGDAVYAPLILELTAGLLVQAPQVASTYHEEIYFAALGDRRIREINLELDHKDALTAAFTTKTTTTKDSRLDQPEVTTKEERFAGGKYTIGQNGSQGAFDPSVNEEAMLQYLQNQLISTIMLPQYIADCQVETLENTVRYTFTGNAAFAEFLCRNAGQQLYGDPDLLVSNPISIKTEALTCYLEVEKDTDLPVSSGINFAGSYEAEGLPYRFTYEISQTYDMG